jgi:hypothetical protein
MAASTDVKALILCSRNFSCTAGLGSKIPRIRARPRRRGWSWSNLMWPHPLGPNPSKVMLIMVFFSSEKLASRCVNQHGNERKGILFSILARESMLKIHSCAREGYRAHRIPFAHEWRYQSEGHQTRDRGGYRVKGRPIDREAHPGDREGYLDEQLEPPAGHQGKVARWADRPRASDHLEARYKIVTKPGCSIPCQDGLEGLDGGIQLPCCSALTNPGQRYG